MEDDNAYRGFGLLEKRRGMINKDKRIKNDEELNDEDNDYKDSQVAPTELNIMKLHYPTNRSSLRD
jgi:hypothetical protein